MVSCRISVVGWPRTVCTRMALLHNCSIVVAVFLSSHNRTNPEMNPNPVSHWSDLWTGSRGSLMVSKQNGKRFFMYFSRFFFSISAAGFLSIFQCPLWIPWSVAWKWLPNNKGRVFLSVNFFNIWPTALPHFLFISLIFYLMAKCLSFSSIFYPP